MFLKEKVISFMVQMVDNYQVDMQPLTPSTPKFTLCAIPEGLSAMDLYSTKGHCLMQHKKIWAGW